MTSIVSYEWADEYIRSSLPDISGWETADEEQRRRFLNAASFYIEMYFDFEDDVFIDPVPERLMIAVCYQAVWMLANPDQTEAEKQIQSASAGPLSVTYKSDYRRPLLCPAAVQSIGDLGTLKDFNGNSISWQPLAY
jgi:hypothetical protein